jgi:ligand-binding sensor domain-containing protein
MRPPTLSVVLLAWLAAAAECGQLPLRVFTTVEGLANNSVHRIVADSRGFLWFATSEGLSRFDGEQFTTYGTDQGLPHRAVNDLLEARNGIFWIASVGGLTRFDPRANPAFRTYLLPPPAVSNSINAVLEDDDGAIWCGATDGLYRFAIDSGTFARIDFVQPREIAGVEALRLIPTCHPSTHVIATVTHPYKRRGQVSERFPTHECLPTNDSLSLLQDSQGRLWVGTAEGLCQIAADSAPGRPSVLRTLRMKDGLPDESVQSLRELRDGHLWIGTKAGLAELPAQSSSPRAYSSRPGLGDFNIESLAEDRGGNLWIGTDGEGVMQIPRDGFVSFTAADGLAPGAVVSISPKATVASFAS